jgi:hypothetical protein
MRKRSKHKTLGAVVAGVLATSASADTGAAAPPRRPAGFQNNYLSFEPKGLPELLRWRWGAWRDGLPAAPKVATP